MSDEPKPCPTCGYQIDRVERLNNENAQLRKALGEIYGLANRPSDVMTIGTYMHNIWLIAKTTLGK